VVAVVEAVEDLVEVVEDSVEVVVSEVEWAAASNNPLILKNPLRTKTLRS